jgi:hypothetical protein
MSPLAEAIYEILRRRVKERVKEEDPRITYKDLALALRDFDDAFEHAHHRNPQLYLALGELGRECRRLKLPPMPALVVRSDSKRPGDAYFESKSMLKLFKDDRINVWRRDVEAVRRTKYPKRKT